MQIGQKFSVHQVNQIIDKVVPLVVGNEEDEAIIRFVLQLCEEKCSNAHEFTQFVEKVLKAAAAWQR